jgi:hypothetical protein
MRGVAVAFAVTVGVAAGVAAGSAHAVQPPVIGMPVDGSPSLTSSTRSGTATVTVHGYPLLCGKPRGSLVVTFPAAVDVPGTIAAGSVHVNGQAAAKVAVHGRNVTVAVPLPTGVTCQSITLGRVTLVFGTGAHIGSAKAGTYAVAVRQGARRYKATLTVGG